jgi:cytochrome c oxidase subunit IV
MENTQAIQAHGAETGEVRGKDPIVKSLMRVFWILLVITLVEIAMAFLHYFTHFPPRMLLNAIFIGLTIVKAFYIIGEFMHLRHEVRNLILTFLIPLILLVWAIIAFMWDGSSWQSMRDHERNVIAPTTEWQKVSDQND